ncbi:MAG: DUF58 domain-containing protein [Desulfurococcales archaeon]|nr:DUF58 domain-containing protein [Desulfurococcales archaeon]
MSYNVVYVLIAFSFILAATSALLYFPSTTPLSPWNTGGNGLSSLVNNLGFKPVLNPEPGTCNTTILVPLTQELSDSQALNLSQLATCGARIVIADSNGYSRPLLEKLGIYVGFTDYQVMDEVSKYKSRWIPVGTIDASTRLRIAVPNATYIEVYTKPDVLEAKTSRYSYVDVDGDGYYTTQDDMGSFTVAVGWRAGKGVVILVPSVTFLSNRYIHAADNTAFLEWVSNGTSREIMLSTANQTVVDTVKYYMYVWTHKQSTDLAWILVFAVSSILTFLWGVTYIPRRSNRSLIKTVLLTATLASIPLVLEAVETGRYTYLLAPLLSLATVSLDPVIPVSVAVGEAASSLLVSRWGTLAYLAVMMFVSEIMMKNEGQGIIGPRVLGLLVLQAALSLVAFIYPLIIPPLAVVSILMIALAILVYLAVTRHVRIGLFKRSIEAYAGSPVNIGLSVETRYPVVLMVSGEGVSKTVQLDSPGLIDLEYTPDHTGTRTLRIKAVATDTLGLTWRDLGYVMVRMNVLPQSYRMLAKAGALLAGTGRGDLLAKLSVTLVLHSEQLRGKMKVASGGELAGLAGGLGGTKGGSGRGLHGGGSRLIAGIIREYLEGLGELEARIGDYMGVREYVPGDDPRNIHWKRSLSIQRLTSKEYATPGGSGSSSWSAGRGGLFLLACMECSWSTDLDYLLTRILSVLVNQSERNPESRFTLLLHTESKTLILDGTVMAVLELLYRTLRENPLELKYEYQSLNTYLSRGEIEYMLENNAEPPYKVIATSFLIDHEAITRVLHEARIEPPMDFAVVHCKPASSRASFLVYTLSRAGYRYVREAVQA